MINPHNPDFITKVPWYLNEQSGESNAVVTNGIAPQALKHHHVQKVNHELSLEETDALIQEKIKAKRSLEKNSFGEYASTARIFKKGACKNCGSTTHKENW